jgi:hypothetical protein
VVPTNKSNICPHAVDLMTNLAGQIKRLPDSVPEANDGDDILAFAHEPVLPSGLDAWEILDPMLNRAVGYGATAEQVAGYVAS